MLPTVEIVVKLVLSLPLNFNSDFFFIKGLEHSERQAFRKTWLFVFISFVCTQKKKSTKNLFELDEMVRFTLWEDESPDPEKKKQ